MNQGIQKAVEQFMDTRLGDTEYLEFSVMALPKLVQAIQLTVQLLRVDKAEGVCLNGDLMVNGDEMSSSVIRLAVNACRIFTVNSAISPMFLVTLSGCVVITGAVSALPTVITAALDVTVLPVASFTTQRYF